MKLNRVVTIACVGAVILMTAAFRPGTQLRSDLPGSSLARDTTKGLDPATGFVIAEGIDLMRAHCTGCHSSKLITQFRASREVWLEKIRWMQKTQNLWDLGEAEPKILDYLAKYYAPTDTYERRAPLKNVQWHKLSAASRH